MEKREKGANGLFTFNGIDSSTYLIVNKVKHSVLPPLEPRLRTAPRRAGAYDFGVDVGTREIEVDVTVIGTDGADLRGKVRDIAEWLYQEDLCPLVFSDEPDKTYYARLSGDSDLEQIRSFGKGTLAFLCPDPFALGSPSTQTIEKGYPANPTFNRDSQAYGPDGSYYGTDIPRYVAGQLAGTQAIMVEEGTTNLIPNPTVPAATELAVTAGSNYTLSMYDDGVNLASAKIEHKKLETTQADFQAGTIGCGVTVTATGELTLAAKTGPTFTRSGLAWDENGVQTADGVPRYGASKFDHGILIEEAATNLLSQNHSSFATDVTTSITATGGTVAQDNTTSFVGSTSAKFDVTTAGDTFIELVGPNTVNGKACYAVSASTAYTFSAYVKSADGVAKAHVRVIRLDSTGAVIDEVVGNDVLTTTFSRSVIRFITPANCAGFLVRLQHANTGTVWFDGCQLEQKDHETSWVVGGTTRNKEDLTVPVANSLAAAEGTIEMVFQRTTDPAQWANLFAWGFWTSPITTDQLTIGHNTGTGLNIIYAEYREKTSATSQMLQVTLPANTVVGQSYYVALRYKFDGANGYMKLDIYDYTAAAWYSNSLTALTIPASNDFVTTYPNAYVGSDGYTYQANAKIDAFRFSGVARDDSVIQSIASNVSTTEFGPLDEFTTYQLEFNNSFSFSNAGFRISPSYSLDNVGTCVGTGSFDWTDTVPDANSAIEYYTRMNTGPWTQQTVHGGSLGLTDGGPLAGVSIQTKTVLKQLVNTSTIPSVSDQTFIVQQQEQVAIKPAFDKVVLTPSNVLRWQLENKAYATSFVDTTRQPETLVINGAEAIFTNMNSSTAEGTIEIRAYEDGVHRNAFIFDTWDGNDYDPTNYDRMLVEKTSSGTYTIYVNNSYLGEVPIASVGWHVFSLRWVTTNVDFLIDGVVAASYTLAASVSTSNIKSISLGCRYEPIASTGLLNNWNRGIDEVRISKVKRTDTELAASVSAYMAVDTNTVYKLDLEGSLNIVAEQTSHDVTVTGTAKVYPIITADLKQPTSSIKISVGDKFILINHDFQFGDQLTIDLEKANVTVNGMRIMNKVDLTSQFFPLNKGVNTFVIEPNNLADIDVQFSERWL